MNLLRWCAFFSLMLLPSVAWAEKPLVIVIKPDWQSVQPRPLARLITAIAENPRQDQFILRCWTLNPMGISFVKANYNRKTQVLFLASGDTRSGKSLIRYSKVTPAKLKRCYGWGQRYSESSGLNLDMLDSYGCPKKVVSGITWYVSP